MFSMLKKKKEIPETTNTLQGTLLSKNNKVTDGVIKNH